MLCKLSTQLLAAQQRLLSAEFALYHKQREIRASAEVEAHATRRAQTALAQHAWSRLAETQGADERAITAAAWKN